MTTDPHGPSPEVPPPGGDPNYVRSKVQGPAIGLIVTAVIGILLMILSLVSNIANLSADPAEVQAQLEAQNPELQDFEGFDVRQFYQGAGAIGIVLNIIGILIGAFLIYAAMQMMNLRSHGMAFAASILAMIPCISPCCILGLPIGIWSIVVLNDPQVKAAFH